MPALAAKSRQNPARVLDAKSNVIPMPRRAPKYTQIPGAEQAMRKLRWEMHFYDTQWLADAVGVSKSCIFSIQRGSTKWPRPHTFFGLLTALGLELHIVKKGGAL